MPTDVQYPFKVYSAESPIDFSLFCHIHADAFIGGSYKLEGNNFGRTIVYLNKFITSGRDGGHVNLELLNAKLAGLSEIQEKLLALDTLTEKEALNRIQILAEELAQRVNSLEDNHYLSMPGGWKSAEGGHAMVYQFRKKMNASGLAVIGFYIYNSGDGIQYHAQISAQTQELFHPIQAYEISYPTDCKKLTDFIQQLLLPRCGFASNRKRLSAFDAERLYKQVFSYLHYLDARLISITDGANYAYTPGQYAGICTQNALQQMLKENLGDITTYQQVMYHLKRYSLEDFITEIMNDQRLQDKRILSQVLLACDSMLEMLRNLDALFEPEEQQREVNAILAYKRNVTALYVKNKLGRDEIKPAAGELSTVSELSQDNPIVFATTQTIPMDRVELCNPDETSDLPQFQDFFPNGQKLLEKLDDFIAYAESLEVKEDCVAVIQLIESFFLNLPLPPQQPAASQKNALDPKKRI